MSDYCGKLKMAINSCLPLPPKRWRLFLYSRNLSVPTEYDGSGIMPVSVKSLIGLMASASSYLEGVTIWKTNSPEKPILETQSGRMATGEVLSHQTHRRSLLSSSRQYSHYIRSMEWEISANCKNNSPAYMVLSKQSQTVHSCLSYLKWDPWHLEAEVSHSHVSDSQTYEQNKMIVVLRHLILGSMVMQK